MGKYTYARLAIALLNPGSEYEFMLTSLSQFQAQGWEKWLSWIGFAWKGKLSKMPSVA